MLDYGKHTSFAEAKLWMLIRKQEGRAREREREREEQRGRDVKECARSVMIEIKIIFSAGGPLYGGTPRTFLLPSLNTICPI
jgi:hypothetical protein